MVTRTNRNIGGRPQAGQGKRDYRISVQVNQAELDLLQTEAEETGIPLATLVRVRAVQSAKKAKEAQALPA